METKHTPGEWASKELQIYNTETGKTIAQVGKWGATREEEAEANAKVIAAAPKLLKAAHNALVTLEALSAYLSDHNTMNGFAPQTIAELKAAIQKATT